MNFAKFGRTLFLQNTTRRLLLIIAVLVVLVMKGELTSETVNYDDTKAMYQCKTKCNLLRSTLQVKQQVSEAVVRRFLKLSSTPQKNMCLSLLACNSIEKRLQYRCFSVKFTKFLRTPFYRKAAVAASEV